MNFTWYTDESANIAYERMRQKLDPIVEDLFPEHELSHVGFNRNFDTEEVIVKLHLNKIGRIRVVPDNQVKTETKKLT